MCDEKVACLYRGGEGKTPVTEACSESCKVKVIPSRKNKNIGMKKFRKTTPLFTLLLLYHINQRVEGKEQHARSIAAAIATKMTEVSTFQGPAVTYVQRMAPAAAW